jgi:hypothetical protein
MLRIVLAPLVVMLCAVRMSFAAADDSLHWRGAEAPGFQIAFTDIDRPFISTIQRDAELSRARLEAFFDDAFTHTLTVRVFPDRASLTAFWRNAWQAPEFQPQCWMVASGTGSMLAVLSPRVWQFEACEHDPRDSIGTLQLIAHEMVHVFHGQHNPRPELDGLDDIAWYVEGLAAYASGQMERSYSARVHDAVEKGKLPRTLEDAWTGPYRYAISGSLVQYIDRVYGRKTLVAMLRSVSEKELLGILGSTEPDFLARWETSLRATGEPVGR